MVALLVTIFGIGALTRPFTRDRDGRLTMTIICFGIVVVIAAILICGGGR